MWARVESIQQNLRPLNNWQIIELKLPSAVSMGTATVEQSRNALKEMSGVAKQAVE